MVIEEEGFASRWSRRKQAVARETNVVIEDRTDVADSIDLVTQEPVDEATQEKQRLEKLNELTDEDMPDIDTLNEDSDFSGFMSTGVSEVLRKMALQKLFHGKTYNIRDGLDEYDGDYTSFEKLDSSVITCDMKHALEVEAEKLLAKQKEEEAENLAQLDDGSADDSDSTKVSAKTGEGEEMADLDDAEYGDENDSLNEGFNKDVESDIEGNKEGKDV